MLILLQMTSLTIPYHHIAISCMLLLVWNLSIIPHVSGQSNYASHANNIGYQGEGLPEEATLDGKVSITYCFVCAANILKLFSDRNTNQAYFTQTIMNLNLKVKVCFISRPCWMNGIEHCIIREKYIIIVVRVV